MPELLAPAGNEACLHAAVQAGADAVYLGSDVLNARRGAGNFTLEELPGACDYAHLRGVAVYLAVNTVVLPSELDTAVELVRQAWRAGVDAVIVQDLGLASLLRQQVAQVPLHASTQMNTHNAADVKALAALGFARVTFARELALPELDALCATAHGLGMQAEAFVHGALCICYSGQCYASSALGGRSANRGMCAQACRLPYQLVDASLRKPVDADGQHLLSPKDLCAIDLVPQMLQAGVDSFKVEGRMKSPEYVFAATSAYRSALDGMVVQHRQLEESFSRGFTQGYLTGQTGMDMMSTQRPNNRGAFLGRVAKVGQGRVHIDCQAPLAKGDVVEFWTGSGHFAHTVDSFEAEGQRYALPVTRKVGKGDRVFRVRSAEAAFADDASMPRIPVSGCVELRLGQPSRLTLEASGPLSCRGLGSAAGRSGAAAIDDLAAARPNVEDPSGHGFPISAEVVKASAEGPVVEPARTKAITTDEVHEHVGRFGTTPFALQSLDVHLDEGAGMGFGALHALRSQAAEALQEALLAPWKGRMLAKGPQKASGAGAAPHRPSHVDVCVLATNAACARAARKAGADGIFVPALNYKRGQGQVAGQVSDTVEQAGYPKQAAIALPVASHDRVDGSREAAFDFDPWAYVKPGKPVLAESFGDVVQALERGALAQSGPHVPATNAATVRLLASLGVARVWLSPELSLGQIQRIAEECDAPLGVALIGQQELMVTEHCLLQSQGPCSRECAGCSRRKSPHFLRDRQGYDMPVVTDCLGRSHLYNAVLLDVAHAAPDLVAAGVGAFMVDTTLMTVQQATEAVKRAVRARDLAVKGSGAVARVQGTTTGHLFRTVE